MGRSRASEQQPPAPARPAQADTPAESLVSDDWDEKTDYTAIRMAYAARPDYNAYASQMVESALVADAMADWNAGRGPEALEKLQKLVEKLPLSLEGHRRMADGLATVLPTLKVPKVISFMRDLEHHHRTIYRGIIDSIRASGDGKTRRTAYKVISIQEEDWLLRELKLKKISQSVGTDKGKSYDRIEVQSLDGKKSATVLFDVSLFYR